MTLRDVLIDGAKVNRAFRRPDWPKEIYAYHGIDNQVCFSDGSPFSMAIATLLYDDYELADAPYHGPLPV